MLTKGTQVRACFREKHRTTTLFIETEDAARAKATARKWAAATKCPITRLNVKEHVIFNVTGQERKMIINRLIVRVLPF